MIPISFTRELNRLGTKRGNDEEIIVPWSCEGNEFRLEGGGKIEKKIEEKSLLFVNNKLRGDEISSNYYRPVSSHLDGCLRVFTLVTFSTSLALIVGLLYLTMENKMSHLKDLFLYSTSVYFGLISIFGILALLFIKFDTNSLRERQRRFDQVLQNLNLTHFLSRGLYWKSGIYGSYLIARPFTASSYKIDKDKVTISSTIGQNLEFTVPEQTGMKFSFTDLENTSDQA